MKPTNTMAQWARVNAESGYRKGESATAFARRDPESARRVAAFILHGTTSLCACETSPTEHESIPYEYRDIGGLMMVRPFEK